METYTALIIDDEAPARALVKAFLQDFEMINIVGECDNGFDGLKQIKRLVPDMVFLDVQMPKLTGFEMLELLETPTSIIFTTAYDQFAIKAFEMSAVDYLLKPFSKSRFKEALDKAIYKVKSGRLQDAENIRIAQEVVTEVIDRVVVNKGSEIFVIPLSQVTFFEAQEDYVMIHSDQGNFLKSKTMKYFENVLPDRQFVRIHRSYIANVSRIKKLEQYDKETYMAFIDEDRLRISRSGYKKLKQVLNL